MRAPKPGKIRHGRSRHQWRDRQTRSRSSRVALLRHAQPLSIPLRRFPKSPGRALPPPPQSRKRLVRRYRPERRSRRPRQASGLSPRRDGSLRRCQRHPSHHSHRCRTQQNFSNSNQPGSLVRLRHPPAIQHWHTDRLLGPQYRQTARRSANRIARQSSRRRHRQYRTAPSYPGAHKTLHLSRARLPRQNGPCDCHWTSLNFWNAVPDDRFSNPNYVREQLGKITTPFPNPPSSAMSSSSSIRTTRAFILQPTSQMTSSLPKMAPASPPPGCS